MTQRSLDPILFFSHQEKKAIVQAIQNAERSTSGEIRVHLEKKTEKPVPERAKEIFEKIGMTQTKERNGILFYLCISNRQFAILGDEGIHAKVPPDFWKAIAAVLTLLFKQDRFADGLCEGIHLAAEQLKTYFPFNRDDLQELPDEISYS